MRSNLSEIAPAQLFHAGVNGQNSEGMCQGGKPGTGKLYTDVCLCCSAHTSGCVVDGLGATATF